MIARTEMGLRAEPDVLPRLMLTAIYGAKSVSRMGIEQKLSIDGQHRTIREGQSVALGMLRWSCKRLQAHSREFGMLLNLVHR